MKQFFTWVAVGVIISLGLSFASNWWMSNKYEIDSSITMAFVNKHHGALLSEIEQLYEIDDPVLLESEVERLEKSMTPESGILSLSQQDKGQTNVYGDKYFFYVKDQYLSMSFYTNSSLRTVKDFMRGQVETDRGKKYNAIQYRKNIDLNGEKLEIRIILDYEHLKKLAAL